MQIVLLLRSDVLAPIIKLQCLDKSKTLPSWTHQQRKIKNDTQPKEADLRRRCASEKLCCCLTWLANNQAA